MVALGCLLAGCAEEVIPGAVTDSGTAPTLDASVDASGCAPPGAALLTEGSWRVVAYELEDLVPRGASALDASVGDDAASMDGGAALVPRSTRYTAEGERLIDNDAGTAPVVRVNGAAHFTATTLNLAFGLLRDDRFDIVAPASPYVSTYAGVGELTNERRLFLAGAGMANLQLCRDPGGAIVATSLGGAVRRLFLQPDTAAAATAREFTLRLRVLPSTRAAPLTAPRTAIFWELPGRAGFVEDLGAAASMAGATSERALRLDALRVEGAAVAAAVGHPALYDDVDGNGRYNGDRDTLRSVAQLALGWRAPGEDAGAAGASLRPGWQVVAVHRAGDGDAVAIPMDRATFVPVEFVATDAPAGPLPDALR
jgi:hypothetical protein